MHFVCSSMRPYACTSLYVLVCSCVGGNVTMEAYMCVFVCACVCMCIHVFVCVCMRVHMHTHGNTCACARACGMGAPSADGCTSVYSQSTAHVCMRVCRVYEQMHRS